VLRRKARVGVWIRNQKALPPQSWSKLILVHVGASAGVGHECVALGTQCSEAATQRCQLWGITLSAEEKSIILPSDEI